MHNDTKSNILSVVLVYHSLLLLVHFTISMVIIEHAKMLACTFSKVRWIASTTLSYNHTSLSYPLSGKQTPGYTELLPSTF